MDEYVDPPELAAFASLDHDRARRRGYPEAVYCQGKTPEQIAIIAAAARGRPAVTLFTRAGPAHAKAVLSELPDAFYDVDAALLAWPPVAPPPSGGLVVVVSAGTSDLPVAREAQLDRRVPGSGDGTRGGRRRGRAAPGPGSASSCCVAPRVVVVAAGMDGALPTVVAGLVSGPVVALPTSVGYGASFQGVAALLTMLNACAPGVAVVNIDNGYGAGHIAAQIAAPARESG